MRLFIASILLLPVIAFAQEAPPLKALLITGGCCHDYFHQSRSLTTGSSKLANIDWTVVHEGNKSTNYKAKIYDRDDWAKGFDVVVHNECFARVTDLDFIHKITDTHADGVPAVVIHCAMHTYRDIADDSWRQFLGVTSKRHEHQSSKKIVREVHDHPVMKHFPETWTCKIDELYVIEKVWPNTTVLANGIAESEKIKGEKHAAFWVNQWGKARVFGTTFGHSNETFDDPVFIDTVTRGMLWAADKLDDDGNPKAGYAAAKPKQKKR